MVNYGKLKNRTQFIVMEKDIAKRKEFYDYIHDNYELVDRLEYMIEDVKFPFIIDFKTNHFDVCHSITCCACAAQAGVIIPINQFKEIIQERKK